MAQQLDASGNVTASYLHDSFGGWAGYSTLPGVDDVFGWGGQWGYYTDGQTGLRLCGHRFYDINTGRWLTRDPIGYNGGVNLYGYCGNDSVNAIDPSGCDATNGQTGPFPVSGGGPLGGGTTVTLNSGGGKSTTVSATGNGPLGPIIISITPPQRDQPPGAPIGKSGAGPGSFSGTGTFPITTIGNTGLQVIVGGGGKLDGSGTNRTGGVGIIIHRTTIILQDTSTTNGLGTTSQSGTGSLGYGFGGGGSVKLSVSGTTLATATTTLSVGLNF